MLCFTHISRHFRPAVAIVALCFFTGSAVRAKVIVGPDQGNGSFEAATTAPWLPQNVSGGPFGSYQVINDPAQASHGDKYLRLNGSSNPQFLQRFVYDPAEGRHFEIGFDLRVDELKPFADLFLALAHPTDPTVGTTYVSPTGWIQNGPPSAIERRRYIYQWTFSPLQPPGEMEFGLGFRQFPASDPITDQRTGFLDNVTLVQTPEPAGAAALRCWRPVRC